jgi:hypothetical protein
VLAGKSGSKTTGLFQKQPLQKLDVQEEDDIEEEAKAGTIALPRAFSEVLQVSAGNKRIMTPRRTSLCLL